MTFIVLLFLHRWLILSCLAQSIPVCLKHLSRTIITRSSMWSVLCTFSPVYVLLCFMTTCLGCWYVKWYNTILGKIWNRSGSTCIASCLMKPCFCILKTGEVFRHFHSYRKCTRSLDCGYLRIPDTQYTMFGDTSWILHGSWQNFICNVSIIFW